MEDTHSPNNQGQRQPSTSNVAPPRRCEKKPSPSHQPAIQPQNLSSRLRAREERSSAPLRGTGTKQLRKQNITTPYKSSPQSPAPHK